MAFEVRWEDPDDAKFGWTRASRGALTPTGRGPVSTLYADVCRTEHEHMRHCYELCGSPMARDHILRVIDGWLYVRGPTDDETERAERHRRHQEHVATIIARGRTYYGEELHPEVVELVERLRRHPRINSPLSTLVSHVRECNEAHGYVMGDLHWRMVFGDPPFDWSSTYHELTGEPAIEATRFLRGLTNESTQKARRLRRLARIATSDPELMETVASGHVEALDDDRPAFNRFRSEFRSLLRRFGHHSGQGWGSAEGNEAPTWNMRPKVPLAMIAIFARSDLDAIDRKEKRAAAERRRVTRRARKILKDDRGKLERFEEALARATRNTLMMEQHNHWMDQSMTGILREAVDLLGRRFVGDGVIDDPDDVLLLSLAELDAIAQDGGPDDLRAMVAERRRKFVESSACDAPKTIGGAVPSDTIDISDGGEGLVGTTLRGIAASSGRYTGRARVFPPSHIPPDVADGDILVAYDAGPDWTPVFAVLGAVVLDKGAAFQHAAVMAREFGIPAVTGTNEGTTVIAEGQTITVDGDTGTVELA